MQLLIGLLLIWMWGTSLAQDLPDIGDPSGAIISPEQERRLGEAFMRSARSQLVFIEDPEINQYIQNLGYHLASNSDNPHLNFTFFIIDAPSINAFAAPGGFIGIHSGLFLTSQSEAELAAVLAHEIAHVTQRHLARTIEAASQMSLPRAATLLAAILLSTQSAQAGQAALATVAAGAYQQQINFTRANEQEADRLGMQVLHQSRFDPNAMPAFFGRMHQNSRLYGDQIPEFLRTHPIDTSRIADAQARAEKYPKQLFDDSLEFHLIREKLRVLTQTNMLQTVAYFEGRLRNAQYRHREATLYGYALALLKNGRHDDADKILKQLRKTGNTRIGYVDAAAQIALAQRKSDQAIALYQDALELYPHNTQLTIGLAKTYLQTGAPAQAKQLLQEQLRFESISGTIYQLLARASKENKQPADAHYFQAEYFYYKDQLQLALEQLELAQKIEKTDFVQRAKIDARVKTIQAEIKNNNQS